MAWPICTGVLRSRSKKSKAWKTRSRDRRTCWLGWLFWPTKTRVESRTRQRISQTHNNVHGLRQPLSHAQFWTDTEGTNMVRLQELPRHPVSHMNSLCSLIYSETPNFPETLQSPARTRNPRLHNTFDPWEELSLSRANTEWFGPTEQNLADQEARYEQAGTRLESIGSGRAISPCAKVCSHHPHTTKTRAAVIATKGIMTFGRKMYLMRAE